jgi:hypothetical protein
MALNKHVNIYKKSPYEFSRDFFVYRTRAFFNEVAL